MKTHLSDITERLRNELDLTFRHTQLPLLSLILLLFAAAPVFAQDMDEDEETEMEEIETDETEEELLSSGEEISGDEVLPSVPEQEGRIRKRERRARIFFFIGNTSFF